VTAPSALAAVAAWLLPWRTVRRQRQDMRAMVAALACVLGVRDPGMPGDVDVYLAVIEQLVSRVAALTPPGEQPGRHLHPVK
jgi:hypothetical protein